MDEQELYFLILHFLKNRSPCQQSVSLLQKELALQRLLPKGISDYEKLASMNPSINPDTLLSLLRAGKSASWSDGSEMPEFHCSALDPSFSNSAAGDDHGEEEPLPSYIDVDGSLWFDYKKTPFYCVEKKKIENSKRRNLDRLLAYRNFCYPLNIKNACFDRIVSSGYTKLTAVLGHLYPVYCIVFDKSGQKMVTAGDDGLAKVWCTRTGRLINTFRGHDNNIADLSISSDNRLLATASEDRTIKVWNLTDRSIVTTLFAPQTVHTVHFLPLRISSLHGYLLATFSDGFARCWKYNVDNLSFDSDPIVYNCKSLHRDAVRLAAVSKGGTRFATGGTDGVVRLFTSPSVTAEKDGVDGSLVHHSFTDHRGFITNIAFSNRGDRLASGSLDGTARIYYFDSTWNRWKSLCLDMKPVKVPVAAAAVSAPSRGSATPVEAPEPSINHEVNAEIENMPQMGMEEDEGPSTSRRITRDQLRREREEQELAERRERELEEAQRAAQERLLIDSSNLDYVMVDNIGHGSLNKKKRPKKPKVTMIVWNIDDSLLVTASSDRLIRVWQSCNGKLLHALKFHDKSIFVLAAHPVFSEIVLSAGYDGKICLWNVFSGRLVKSFEELGRCFLDGQFSEDGTMFALTDNTGRCALYGLGKDPKDYENVPFEQFRLVDFDEIIFDAQRFPMHPIAQAPPHEFFGPILDGNKGVLNDQPPERYGCDIPTELEAGIWHRTVENMIVGENAELDLLKLDYEAYKHVELISEEALKRTRHKRVEYGTDVEEDDEEYDDEVDHGAGVVVMTSTGSNSLLPAALNGHQTAVAQMPENPAVSTVMAAMDDGPAFYQYDDETDDEEFDIAYIRRNFRGNRRINTRSRHHNDDDDDEEGEQFEEMNSDSDSGDEEEEEESATPGSGDEEQFWRPKKARRIEYDRYFPSEWITANKRQTYLYMPQMGDIVAYFRQGQEELLKSWKKDKSTYPHFFESLPYEDNPELSAVVPGIEYFAGTPAWCQIKIALITESQADSMMNDEHQYCDKDLAAKRQCISVKVMFQHQVSDYVILWSLYRWGVHQDWRVNQTVKVLLDGESHEGTITAHVPCDLNRFPTSPWSCYMIKWIEGDDMETFSPWELMQDIVLARNTGYRPFEDRDCIPDVERRRIVQELKSYNRSHGDIVGPFLKPVSLDLYPDYCTVVGYPMDIGLVLSRLQNNYYRRFEALIWDIRQIERNAILFNDDDSEIVSDAKCMVLELMEQVLKLNLLPRGSGKGKMRYASSEGGSHDSPRIASSSSSRRGAAKEKPSDSDGGGYASTSSVKVDGSGKRGGESGRPKRFRLDPVLSETIFGTPVSEFVKAADGSRFLRQKGKRKYNEHDIDDVSEEEESVEEEEEEGEEISKRRSQRKGKMPLHHKDGKENYHGRLQRVTRTAERRRHSMQAFDGASERQKRSSPYSLRRAVAADSGSSRSSSRRRVDSESVAEDSAALIGTLSKRAHKPVLRYSFPPTNLVAPNEEEYEEDLESKTISTRPKRKHR